MPSVRLDGRAVTVADVVAVARGAAVELAPETIEAMARARGVVERTLAAETPTYGLNTQLGQGRDTAVDADEIAAFQDRVIDNHRGSIGEPLPDEEVRALVFARLAGFARGGSGVRPALAAAYAALLGTETPPEVYRTGSVGASDLALLAEVAAVVRRSLPLAAGEALAAISANSYSIGVGALVVDELRALLSRADLVAALSLEAAGVAGTGGNLSPFDARLHAVRPSPGQRASAAAVRAHLEGSFLGEPGRQASVQDALSFRTVPQVHGAVRDAVERAAAAVEDELNAPGDNPLVLSPAGPLGLATGGEDRGAMLSGGNFEPLGLALAFESLRVALAHLAGLSERRTAVLSALIRPLRRAGENRVPGLVWYSAAAQLAEVRHLATPVSASGAQLSEIEDHASFAPLALQLAQRQLGLVGDILAIEALHAAELLLAHGSGRSLGRGTAPLAAALLRGIAESGTGREQLAIARSALDPSRLRDTMEP